MLKGEQDPGAELTQASAEPIYEAPRLQCVRNLHDLLAGGGSKCDSGVQSGELFGQHGVNC